jgi:hypothetical protein
MSILDTWMMGKYIRKGQLSQNQLAIEKHDFYVSVQVEIDSNVSRDVPRDRTRAYPNHGPI